MSRNVMHLALGSIVLLLSACMGEGATTIEVANHLDSDVVVQMRITYRSADSSQLLDRTYSVGAGKTVMTLGGTGKSISGDVMVFDPDCRLISSGSFPTTSTVVIEVSHGALAFTLDAGLQPADGSSDYLKGVACS